MTKEEFFKKIIEKCGNDQTRIIRLLQARGFLIDCKNGEYYLSDNAAIEDYDYLEYLLANYNLGEIKGINCRECNEAYDVIKKTIIPYTAKIVIFNNARLTDAIKLFENNERISFPVCIQSRGWSEFCFRTHGNKLPVKILEPYIAYFVKALSACGVYTNYSCDGNHPDGDRIVVGSDYPFCVWQDFLIKKYLSTDFFTIHSKEYFKDRKYEIYYQVILMADKLYENRFELRRIKEQSAQFITRKYRHTHTDLEIEELFLQTCNELFESGGNQ